ncbi:2'-5' RNA ligase family protein [Deinococcus peraridilitoris]|uniref:2'-5' RNA ligase n=1 Tax=Deinococcus peraridilitoris (strain DSM 19664 / LMG 22246 / CIP 109416 / KR-200) TaxID=937777 RepID=K9ZX94_DEIPD|nr:2'-5' RNA ligase family protein [Deinococcus peraridilitoris]AFZ65819.1 hypothetical protein Deipe_0216 [Deinococcus peraridilitoris DSM 19664]
MGLYSLVAWPPERLARWVTDVQREHAFASYGAPHLNLRTPFEYSGDEGLLIDAVALAVTGLTPFEVEFRAWRRFPHTIFLELNSTRLLMEAHARVLSELPVPGSERDASGYLPHLTLALGLCPWAEESAWEAIRSLVPPVLSWTVDAFALTLENRGEIVELARYPLNQRATPGTPELTHET